jgi:hypothetical protein
MNRREVSRSLLSSIASFALLQTLFQREAFAQSIRPVADQWLRGLHEMSWDLRMSTITPGQWQTKVAELFKQVSLEAVLARIDFARLTVGLKLPDLGVNARDVTFPDLQVPERLAFHSKIFGMRKSRAIIPHGHRNMVSCHYVLKGEFRLRQYNRVADDATHMIIEPTVDELARVGSLSSISDERNNVHWLTAMTDSAFTYDVLVTNLGGKQTEVNNIDPDTGEKAVGNQVRVRKLTVDEALRKYGHDSHHHAWLARGG